LVSSEELDFQIFGRLAGQMSAQLACFVAIRNRLFRRPDLPVLSPIAISPARSPATLFPHEPERPFPQNPLTGR